MLFRILKCVLSCFFSSAGNSSVMATIWEDMQEEGFIPSDALKSKMAKSFEQGKGPFPLEELKSDVQSPPPPVTGPGETVHINFQQLMEFLDSDEAGGKNVLTNIDDFMKGGNIVDASQSCQILKKLHRLRRTLNN